MAKINKSSRYAQVLAYRRVIYAGQTPTRVEVSIGFRSCTNVPRAPKVHTIVQGDTLHTLAYKYLNDPGQWWRLADANPGVDLLRLNEGETLLIP